MVSDPIKYFLSLLSIKSLVFEAARLNRVRLFFLFFWLENDQKLNSDEANNFENNINFTMINWIEEKICLLEFGWVRFHCWIPRETKATETKGHSPNWILFALWSCKTRWKTSSDFSRQCCERSFLIKINYWQRGGGRGKFTSYQSWKERRHVGRLKHAMYSFAFCRIPK